MRMLCLFLSFALAGVCLGAEQEPASTSRPQKLEPAYEGKPLGYWIALSRNKNGKARRSAIVALGKIGPDAMPAIPALADLVDAGADDDDRRAALEALWQIDPAAIIDITGFVGFPLNYKDPIHEAVVELLRKTDPKAKAVIAVVAKSLKDKEPRVRASMPWPWARSAPRRKSRLPRSPKHSTTRIRRSGPMQLRR